MQYVVIIQCQIAHNRCSGFACTHSFYEKSGAFSAYGQSTQYISFTCGGCCGKSVSAKLEHLVKKLKTRMNISYDNIFVHLSSCMVTDNYHYERCPHVDFIRKIIYKKGITKISEGTFFDNNACQLRELGIYDKYNSEQLP